MMDRQFLDMADMVNDMLRGVTKAQAFAPVYRFRQWHIRDDMMLAILRFTQDGIHPGDFLTAVICNDLREAVGRADDENLANLPAFVSYFYNEAPASCWGTKDKMEAWMDSKAQARMVR